VPLDMPLLLHLRACCPSRYRVDILADSRASPLGAATPLFTNVRLPLFFTIHAENICSRIYSTT